MPLPLNSFLKELVDILRQDYPLQMQRIIHDAQGIICLQTLDKESAIIQIANGNIQITNKSAKAINVSVYSSRQCLFQLLDGKLTLEEAFHSKEFEVFGEPALLLKCYKIWESILSISRTSPRFYFLLSKLH